MRCIKCKKEIDQAFTFCPHCGRKQRSDQRSKSRGNGTGTVYKLPNGTWIARRVLSYTADESGHIKKETRSKAGFKTKKEALEYLPRLVEKPVQHIQPMTMAELFDRWLPTHQASKSTITCYTSAYKYFEPLTALAFGEITVDDLQECLDDCPKGRRTKENMKALAGLLYKYAIPRHQAPMNLGQYLVIHAEHAEGKAGLPLDALEALRANIGLVPYADYVYCQCYLGFRPSELLALDVKDYDRSERAFTGGSKTDAGKDRIVTVPARIQPIIDRLTADKIAGKVFCKQDGGKMSLEAYRANFYKVLEACGIDNPSTIRDGVEYRKYTPHSCRHTFATLIKRVPGADKDKLELMGHTSTEMLRHYQDVDLSDLRRITDAI